MQPLCTLVRAEHEQEELKVLSSLALPLPIVCAMRNAQLWTPLNVGNVLFQPGQEAEWDSPVKPGPAGRYELYGGRDLCVFLPS